MRRDGKSKNPMKMAGVSFIWINDQMVPVFKASKKGRKK